MAKWHDVAVDGLDKVRVQLAQDSGGVRVTGLDIRATDITSDTFRRLSLPRLVAVALGASFDERHPLGRPSGDGSFYERVADAYRSAAAEVGGRPAVVLAEENGVPVETMRRWVKEARRRGLLGAGRKGRAI